MPNPYPKGSLWFYIQEEKEREKRARQALAAARSSVPRASPNFRRLVEARERRRQDDELFARAITHPYVQHRLVRPLPNAATYGRAMNTVRALGFRAQGPSDYSIALRQPGAAVTAWWLSERAKSRNSPPNETRNDIYDARRHADWAAAMTQRLGAARARAFLDAHERSEPGPDAELAMDVINNHNGQVMGAVLPRMSSAEIARRLGALDWLQTYADPWKR